MIFDGRWKRELNRLSLEISFWHKLSFCGSYAEHRLNRAILYSSIVLLYRHQNNFLALLLISNTKILWFIMKYVMRHVSPSIEERLKQVSMVQQEYSDLWATWELDKQAHEPILGTIIKDYPHFSFHDASHSESI